jgi:hypothetical protein
VALRLPAEGRTRGDPKEAKFVLKVISHY